MAIKNLANLSEEELVEQQIEISNKRAESETSLKAQGLEVQDELDRRALDKRLGDLTPAQADYLREKLATEKKEEKSDG